MKGFSFYLFISLLFTITTACNNSNNNTSNKSITTSLSDAQFVSIKNPDPFFLIIKGNQKPFIIPGKSIGSLQVGAKTDSLQKLGRPQKGDAGMCKSLSRWFYGDSSMASRKELDVFSECDPDDEMRPHVKWIRTNDRAFRTKSDIGIGSTLEEIKSNFDSLVTFATYTAISDSAKMQMLQAKNSGISFEITTGEKDTCRAILVYSPKEKIPAMYFAFYKNLQYTN